MQTRNIRIALDHAHGDTFEAIAVREGLSKQRVYQIWTFMCDSVRIELNVHGVGPVEIGLYAQRFHERLRERGYNNGVFVGGDSDAAREFHFELRQERRMDLNKQTYQGNRNES